MRPSRVVLTTILAIGLLAGSGVGGAAQDEPNAPQGAALVSGHVTHFGPGEFTDESEAEGILMQRGRTTLGQVDLDDPRLSGLLTLVDHADRFFAGVPSDEDYLGDVLWGTIEITNPDGAWTGTSVGTTDPSADGRGVTYYELVGSGAYEGLSAVIFESEIDGWSWNGVIMPGPLPPDR
jgi:hypothetical protein